MATAEKGGKEVGESALPVLLSLAIPNRKIFAVRAVHHRKYPLSLKYIIINRKEIIKSLESEF